MKKNLVLSLIAIASLGALAGALLLPRGGSSPASTTVPEIDSAENSASASTTTPTVVAEAAPVEAAPLTYLPDSISLRQSPEHSLLRVKSTTQVVDRPLQGLRKLVEKDEQGGFLNPILSPDGLQILLTRPGYQGLYIVSAQGGTPEKIADDNAFFAKWTPEGLIQVRNHEGEVRLYDIDGTLLKTGKFDPKAQPAFSEEDVIYVRKEGSSSPVALTDSNDRYIAPEVCPDGEKVAYLGMYSGLYLANPEKGEEPIFLGSGANPQWNSKGTALLYEQTLDDGHAFVQGDIFYYDLNSGTQYNLTSQFQEIGLNPTIGPDGRSVAFESDGSIYSGIIPQ